MKLRFRENSLRLRVNRREVESLASGAILREEIHFPGNSRMAYFLESSRKPSPEAWFREGVIRVCAPWTQVKEWANSDLIGMYFELPTNGALLKIAIEKDLECIDAPAEERDPDAFSRVQAGNC